ncbi:MAG: PH domain-containing protein [Halobacteriota archaeon]
MSGYGRDYWEYPRDRNGATEISSSTPEFATAVRDLDRLIEKARRFYQSGDFEEVVLNAHQIKELYQLCLRDEYKRQGRYTFRLTLRAQIEGNVDSLDYWWDGGIVAFQKIKIGPEIAKTALELSEEMRDYLTSYVDYRSGAASRASQVTHDRSYYKAQSNKKPVSATRPAYPVSKGGLKIDDEQLLYLGRPSIVGRGLAYKGVVLLLAALLFGSFFVGGFDDVATALRGVAVLLFLFVASRTGMAVYSERYGITARDIYIEKGLFFKSTATIPLSRVAKQTKQQSFLGRLLKTGNLVIATHSGHVMAFKGIYDPEEVFTLVAELRESKTFRQD